MNGVLRRSDRGVEIDENLARLRAFSGSQNAALLQNVNDPRRACIPEPEAALQQGSGGSFLLPDNIETLLDQFLVLFRDLFPLFAGAAGGDFLVDGEVVRGRALRGDKLHQPPDLIVSNQYPLRANQPRGARRQIKHVALA